MYLQILKANVKRNVRHMLRRIDIFSLLESEMIKDGWRNGWVRSGGKSNRVTSYKEKLKITKIKQSKGQIKQRPCEFHFYNHELYSKRIKYLYSALHASKIFRKPYSTKRLWNFLSTFSFHFLPGLFFYRWHPINLRLSWILSYTQLWNEIHALHSPCDCALLQFKKIYLSLKSHFINKNIDPLRGHSDKFWFDVLI